MKGLTYILGIVALGIIEFIGFTWILRYAFNSFAEGSVTLLVCASFILFLLWIAKKIDFMVNPQRVLGAEEDGKE